MFWASGTTLYERAHIAWQESGGKQVPVAVQYSVDPGGNVQFSFPEGYDPALPLVIDPLLTHSTYLGGDMPESGNGIALDGEGSAYVTGYTLSTDFPTPPGAYDLIYPITPPSKHLFHISISVI